MKLKIRILLGVRWVLFAPLWIPFILLCVMLALLEFIGDRSGDILDCINKIYPFRLWNITDGEKSVARSRERLKDQLTIRSQ